MDDNSNGYSGRQRANWFSLKERCHQLNMSMTIENFRTDLNYYQFKGNSNQCVDNNNNYLKLLYFHLSDCKRLLGINMYQNGYPKHTYNKRPQIEVDLTSSTGSIIRLEKDVPYFSGAVGQFCPVMPGNYEIVSFKIK
ncbi:unnamed protein product [Didymodactylos carnosus]|uniref:Uncharacterized protein n=1 Tax=Didymodactylos carnosus TaxID=1234261 RepID=A0A8S2FCY0_9BILA|nr:unnamed protein product [Didymodactylos carnosus]CAF4228487.1 unnamed protein product [Didymodactylos carnosus]